MPLNAQLLTAPHLRRIADHADAVSDACTSILDALCNYESAADLPVEERAVAREDAREEMISALDELLAHEGDLRAIRERVEETMPDVESGDVPLPSR